MENYRKKCGVLTSGRSHTVEYRCRCNSSNSSIMYRLKKVKTPSNIRSKKLENNHDQDMEASDSESSSPKGSSMNPRKSEFGDNNGLVKLDEEDKSHQRIKEAFLSGMGSVGKLTNVVAIHKNSFSGLLGQARLQSFRLFSEMMSKKRRSHGGNITYAWYGTSRDGVDRIINHGFSHCGELENSGLYGVGIYLSPHNSPLESVRSLTDDEDGLRHVVLCRVILGNMEDISLGSHQSHPSFKIYDSGVDNILSPKTYIVWSTNMNTHILPEYVISFKSRPCLGGIQEPVERPKSPWMPLSTLILTLSSFLPPHTISLIQKCHKEYQEKKLTRQQMVQHVRRIVGDKLLITVIKSFRTKQNKTTSDSLTSSNGWMEHK